MTGLIENACEGHITLQYFGTVALLQKGLSQNLWGQMTELYLRLSLSYLLCHFDVSSSSRVWAERGAITPVARAKLSFKPDQHALSEKSNRTHQLHRTEGSGRYTLRGI